VYEKQIVTLVVKKRLPFRLNVHYGVHKGPILSHRNSPHTTPLSIISTLILYYHPRLWLPSGTFPSGFPTKSFMHSLSLTSTLHSSSILLDLIVIIIYVVRYFYKSLVGVTNTSMAALRILTVCCRPILYKVDSSSLDEMRHT
jgi:hypothetical protein